MRQLPIALLPFLLATACSQPAPPPPAMPAAEVAVVELRPETVTLSRDLPGRVSPFLVAEVRPQVGGVILRRLFTEGGKVQAGQPLYQLDDALTRADQATAQAALARAQATLESARLNAARSGELAKIDAISKQDNENAIATLRQAEADAASAKAVLARSEVMLGYSLIKSQIAGRIGKSSVTQGALVTANQADALATVQQLDPVHVDVTQSSVEFMEMRRQVAAGKLDAGRNLPVAILLEDGTRYPLEGKLTFEELTIDPTTGSFLVRIVVPNPREVLLPGMYVRAIVGSGVRKNALLVPQQGISRDPKGDTFAMVLGTDGKVAMRPVKVSRTIGDKWLVDDGLAAGDRVIVEGLQKIRPGMPARVASPKPAAPAAAGKS